MSRRNQAHDMVMESLTEALLQLIRTEFGLPVVSE